MLVLACRESPRSSRAPILPSVTTRKVGTGSVFQLANGRWVAQVSIGGRGQRRYRRRLASSQEDAEGLLAGMDKPARPTPEDRFWAFVEKSDGCWLWTGKKDHNGYGQITIRPGVIIQAHRFSYELATGKHPGRLYVCHHCDVKACVRPEHLFAGTQADNMGDWKAKQKAPVP